MVHLAGILMENPTSSYQAANVDATRAVVEACKKAEVLHVVLVSVLGADPDSANRYLSSKGRAERIVVESGLSAAIIRTPILLGPGTAGARAVVHAASQRTVTLLGGGRHSIRPLDVDDLSRAILRCCRAPRAGAAVYELVGPEAVTYREVIARTARMMGREVSVRSDAGMAGHAGSGHRRMEETGRDDANRDRGDYLERSRARECGRRARRDPHAVVGNPREAPALRRPRCGPVTESAAPPTTNRASKTLGRLVFLAITVGCFTYLYYRLNGAAARAGPPAHAAT